MSDRDGFFEPHTEYNDGSNWGRYIARYEGAT